jgi:TonB family protein
VRRVIRQHLNEVRFCYEQGLAERPDLAGRVTVTFLIAGTGAVQASSVASSTIEDRSVESCLANAVRRWTFPASDGPTMVTYPLLFDSAP